MYQPRDYFMNPHVGNIPQYVPDNESEEEAAKREATAARLHVPPSPALDEENPIPHQGLVFDEKTAAIRPLTAREITSGPKASKAEGEKATDKQQEQRERSAAKSDKDK